MSAPLGVDRTLLALADPTRRGVIDLLREKPRKASELADAALQAEARADSRAHERRDEDSEDLGASPAPNSDVGPVAPLQVGDGRQADDADISSAFDDNKGGKKPPKP